MTDVLSWWSILKTSRWRHDLEEDYSAIRWAWRKTHSLLVSTVPHIALHQRYINRISIALSTRIRFYDVNYWEGGYPVRFLPYRIEYDTSLESSLKTESNWHIKISVRPDRQLRAPGLNFNWYTYISACMQHSNTWMTLNTIHWCFGLQLSIESYRMLFDVTGSVKFKMASFKVQTGNTYWICHFRFGRTAFPSTSPNELRDTYIPVDYRYMSCLQAEIWVLPVWRPPYWISHFMLVVRFLTYLIR